MKTKVFSIAVTAIFTGLILTGCGSSKQTGGAPGGQPQKATIGETTDIPCIDHDTDEYYVGVFSLNGPATQIGRLGTDAQRGARQQLIEKMAHDYNGFVEQSTNSAGNNKGNDIEGAIKSAGLDVIKQHVGRLRANCGPSVSKYQDANGNVTVYVSMRMYVKDIVKILSDNLDKNEKDKVNFGHEQNMKKLQEYMSPTKK